MRSPSRSFAESRPAETSSSSLAQPEEALHLGRRELVRQRLKLGKIRLQAAELMPCRNVSSALLLQSLVERAALAPSEANWSFTGSACSSASWGQAARAR